MIALASSVGSTLAAPSGEGAKAGPIGLAVILLLCIACYFLFKSMSRHLKHVREDFPQDDATPTDDGTGEPVASRTAPAGEPPDEPAPLAQPGRPAQVERSAPPAAEGDRPA